MIFIRCKHFEWTSFGGCTGKYSDFRTAPAEPKSLAENDNGAVTLALRQRYYLGNVAVGASGQSGSWR